MRRLGLGLAVLSLLAGCERCGQAPLKTESATVAFDGGAPKKATYLTTDIRSAIVETVPEFRGVTNLVAVAVLEEVLQRDPADGGDLAEALAGELPSRRLSPAHSDAGALIAQSKPYFAEAERVAGHAVVRVGMVIPGEQFADILQTPSPVSTQHLSTMLPVPANTPFLQDTFIFEAHYNAERDRADALLRQLVEAKLKTGWTSESGPKELLMPDGGAMDERFTAVLRDPARGGKLTLTRDGKAVTVVWELPLVKR